MRPGMTGGTGWDWCRPEGDPGHGRDRRRPGCLIGNCRGTGKCRIVTGCIHLDRSIVAFSLVSYQSVRKAKDVPRRLDLVLKVPA